MKDPQCNPHKSVEEERNVLLLIRIWAQNDILGFVPILPWGVTDAVNPTIPCPLFFSAERDHLKALFAHSSPILAPHPCHPFVQREGRRP